MAKTASQKLTANRLRDGEVVYWRTGEWVEAYADGELFAEPALANAALEAAKDFVKRNIVVGLYLFDVREDGSPVKEREILRAAGPSVRRDMGKQTHHDVPFAQPEKPKPRVTGEAPDVSI
jgi:hypothetical protein